MQDTTLYAQILGVESPWRVTAVTPRLDEGEVVVTVDAPARERLACPKCGNTHLQDRAVLACRQMSPAPRAMIVLRADPRHDALLDDEEGEAA